jgi:hypothetical protein
MNCNANCYDRQLLIRSVLVGIWQCRGISARTGDWQSLDANCHLEEDNDKGEVWVRKTVLHLWTFTHKMWEHRNSVLHNMQLKSPRQMWEADINDAITKLYKKVDTYSVGDQWYFDVPLALRLHKPLK